MVGKKLDQNGYRRLRQSWIRRSHYVAGLLPDIKTESTSASGLPVFYKNKTDTHAKDIDGFTSRLLNPLVKSVGPRLWD